MKLTAFQYGKTEISQRMAFQNGDMQTAIPISLIFFLLEQGERKMLIDVGCDTMPGFLLYEFEKPVNLLRIKAQQEEYKKMFGNCCADTDYVFARPDGKMYYPSYPSKLLKKTLLKHNLKYIRFHDLRHSCASMLIMNGWPMKDISDWLGHADINTTMNIYGHLSMEYKRKLGQQLENLL